MAVRRQMDYARARGVPWGISESAYNLVDRHGTYQYKAFGVPGLGLKRGLGDELVVAPYATALAVAIDPAASVANLRRLAALAVAGDYGFFDAIDYTPRGADPARRRHRAPRRAASSSARTSRTTQGMTLVALANALLGDRMVDRFHADPRVQATELLLQERVPRHVADHRAAAARRDARRRAAAVDARCAASAPPHTVSPHTQFLSNGSYVTVVTNAGGGAQLLARPAGHALAARCRRATPDGAVHLPARRARAAPSGRRPISRRAASRTTTRSTFSGRPRRRSAGATATSPPSSTSRCPPKTTSRCGGSPSATTAPRIRELDVTSYAEIVLATPADDLAHPAFGKLFIETEYLPDSAGAALPSPPARFPRCRGVGVSRAEPRGPAAGPPRVGNRSRPLPRPRPQPRGPARAGRPRALGHDRRRARSDLSACASASGSAPGATVRLCFATGMAADRDTAEALARKYHDPNAAARTFALAMAQAQSGLRHLGISAEEAPLFERLASRVLGADDSLRAGADDAARRTSSASPASGRTRISGDLPILLVRVVGDDGDRRSCGRCSRRRNTGG